ncbi:MAG TPA: DUF2141 domain-containing protein [Cellvibrio sp.]|nr:DUF2141 domain-containing protein [Cellvibrio sp.]
MKFTSTHKVLSTLLFSSLLSLNATAHELVLQVDQITKTKGVMMIALYNSADSYKSDKNVFNGQKVAVTQGTLTVNFGDIPAGNYAIKLYQDENENGVIDTNTIGMPTEGYGFSNNGGAMGQPSFDEAKFSVTDKTSIAIRLR